MNTRETDEQDRIVRQGRAAWARLKKDKSWTDWLAVGEALLVGRELAMYEAGTNSPSGKGYAQEFSRWLAANKLDDMDKSDRSKLFTVMENLSAIEAWRATLTRSERLKLNHPTTVLRNWQRATVVPEAKPDKPSKNDALRGLDEELHAARGEIERLKARTAELEEENAGARARIASLEDFVRAQRVTIDGQDRDIVELESELGYGDEGNDDEDDDDGKLVAIPRPPGRISKKAR
jgi:hypothetical protein